MPSKATLFNCKCEPVYDFGTGHRNIARFNSQGNNIFTPNISDGMTVCYDNVICSVLVYSFVCLCFVRCGYYVKW